MSEAYSAEFVDLYDPIYTRMKNYGEEAAQVEAWIRKFRPEAESILDVACGTAEHAKHLKTRFRIDGLDVSENFLAAARRKNPECSYFRGDMSDFELGRKYDVVMSLFSSIGYVLTEEKLHATIGAFAKHLSPNGIVIVEPWLTPDRWRPGLPRMTTIDEPDLKVCRMNTTGFRDGHSLMEFHFLVGQPDGVRHFKEEHLLGLFTTEQMKSSFEANGLMVHHDEAGIFGRGLFMGRWK